MTTLDAPSSSLHPELGTVLGGCTVRAKDGTLTKWDFVSSAPAQESRGWFSGSTFSRVKGEASKIAKGREQAGTGTTFAVLFDTTSTHKSNPPATFVEIQARPQGSADAKASAFMVQDLIRERGSRVVDFWSTDRGGASIDSLDSGTNRMFLFARSFRRADGIPDNPFPWRNPNYTVEVGPPPVNVPTSPFDGPSQFLPATAYTD